MGGWAWDKMFSKYPPNAGLEKYVKFPPHSRLVMLLGTLGPSLFFQAFYPLPWPLLLPSLEFQSQVISETPGPQLCI